jgi:hypothetical protein
MVLDPTTSLFTREWFFWLKNDRWKETAEQTITNGTLVEVAHKLNTTPNEVAGYLKCKTAEAGFAIDDRVALPAFEDGGVDYGVQLTWNETNVGFTPGASGVRLMNKATGAMATITNASWRVVLRCRP